MGSSTYELADVFLRFGKQYNLDHKLTLQQRNAMFAIENCRTEVLGGHIDKCNCCGHERVFYNSCRNRHCPKCGGLKREIWVEKLAASLLPVNYFHVIVTLPSELHGLIFYNPKTLYDIFFKSVSQVLLSLAGKKLRALTGMIAVLHTWGQNLMQHPHLHIMVPAGGWHLVQHRWVPSSKTFFLSDWQIAHEVKKKFLFLLKDARKEGQLMYPGDIQFLEQKKYFEGLLTHLYDIKWKVKTPKPTKNCGHIIQYLGRYTHRVAISNDRIKRIDQDGVTFSWKDRQDHDRWKIMKVSGEEFIRRFLLHILPKGFCKIRYFGVFALCNRKRLLILCRRYFMQQIVPSKYTALTWQQALALVCGIHVEQCPVCKEGIMMLSGVIIGKRAPPSFLCLNAEHVL